jgi:ABC-type Na+ efflux pump permease subunit
LFVTRTVLGLMLAAVLVFSCLGPLGWSGITKELYRPDQLRSFGSAVFVAVMAIETMFLMPLAVTLVGPAIAEEREKGTLPLLLLTRLSRVEIVLTKLIARLLPSLSLVLVGLPIAVDCAWCAGLPCLVLIEAMVIVAAAVVVSGGLSILASARRDRVGAARAQALSWAFMWFLIIPLCTLIPARSGTLWGDLAVELKGLCAWIAPSSPLSLATRYAWFFSQGPGALTEQVVTMLALQAALVVLAVIGAAASLRLREPRPDWWDPYRGFRPRVSDDPIFWREFELPFRGAMQPLIMVQARQVVILLRTLLIVIFRLVGMAIAIAVPIGILIGTTRFGYLAFLELARDGYTTASPSPARGQFNYFIRFVTWILALVPLLVLSAMTTARITIERDKKTWDALLTTPLTGAEILSAKMRVSARGFWNSSRWLIPLWLLGILAGSVNPLTALLAAVELPLAARACLALGAWLGVRPGSGLTSTANSYSALVSLGLGAVVGLTVLVLLCSNQELAEFWIWDIRLRAIVVASLLAFPMLLGALAWILTRLTCCRFDDWVGRPHRSTMQR